MVDSLFLNWVSSYLIGSIPNIREILSEKKDIESRINVCYQKALKKWTDNEILREMVPEEIPTVDSLREFLTQRKDDYPSEYKRLIEIWADELRKDSICYNFIQETKLDKIVEDVSLVKESQGQISTKLDNLLTLEQFNAAITQMTNLGNAVRLKGFIKNLINDTIFPLIESLKVKSALEIIESIEKQCKDLLQSDIELRSDLLCLKGKALRYIDQERAEDCFHDAYQLTPTDELKIIAEIKRVIRVHGFDSANYLVQCLPQDNLFRVAFEVSQSSDPEGEFELYPEIKTNVSVKQEIAELMTKCGKNSIDFLYNDTDCSCPATLSYSNIAEWMYAITFRRVLVASFLKINRDNVDDKYKHAFETTEKFLNLLNETDIRDAFPIVNMLHCYWGILIDGEQSWLTKYQSINVEQLGDQNQVYRFYEICMLLISGRIEDAFDSISRMSDSEDRTVVDLSILIGHDYENDEFVIWGLKQARDKGIMISPFASLILASYLNPDNVDAVSVFISELAFENQIEKDIIIQLCNLAKGTDVDVSSFRDKTDSLSDELTAYAAMLMNKAGDNELAVKILTPRVDETTLDIRTHIFIDVLSSKPQHHPHLYRLLRDNRKRGVHHVYLLKKEAQLASKLADYSGAFEVMEILFNECPNDNDIRCNYAIMWLRSGRPLNEEIKHLIEELALEDVEKIAYMYRTLAETNNLEYSAEFLYKRCVSSDIDELKHLFFSESTAGYIAKIVSRELDEIVPGVCVLLRFKGRPKAIIVKDNTNLGRTLLGKKKGDRVVVLDEEYDVVSIHPYYFKLHADYLDEVMINGGNDRMTPFKIDEDNILESLENAIKQFSPDSLNYEQKKKKLLEDYEAGNIPYLHLIEEPDVIGGYYKGLFTNFKYRVPVAYSSMRTVDSITEISKFVIELPSLLLLFEFSNQSGYIPNTKPIIPHFVYEYLKSKKTYLGYHVSFPFYEAVGQGRIKRFSNDVAEDIQLRMHALIEWIEANCVIVKNEEALAINDARNNDSELSVLFQHTISFLIRKDAHYVLISDEPYYSKQNVSIPTVSTEVFVRLFDAEQYNSLMNFMFRCNIMGSLLTKDIIIDEYNKFQAGQENKSAEIIECISGNPLQFQVVLDASMHLSKDAEKYEKIESYITNMFESCLRIMPEEFYSSQEWKNLIVMLSLPLKGYDIVKRCVLSARQKILS